MLLGRQIPTSEHNAVPLWRHKHHVLWSTASSSVAYNANCSLRSLSVAVSLCRTVILYGKRWSSEWRILCSDRREIPNSAEVLVIDLLGPRIKATWTASMFAGVQTLAGRGRFFSNTEPLISNCWQSL